MKIIGTGETSRSLKMFVREKVYLYHFAYNKQYKPFIAEYGTLHHWFLGIRLGISSNFAKLRTFVDARFPILLEGA